MRRIRISMIVVACAVLVLGVAVAYYASAYSVARGQAVAVALRGPMPGLGLADSTWGVRLGEPGVNDLSVASTSVSQPASPTSLTFSFVLVNVSNSQIPPLSVFVTVGLTAQGWKVTGDGIKG